MLCNMSVHTKMVHKTVFFSKRVMKDGYFIQPFDCRVEKTIGILSPCLNKGSSVAQDLVPVLLIVFLHPTIQHLDDIC